MNIKMVQLRHIKKRIIVKALVLASNISFALFFIAMVTPLNHVFFWGVMSIILFDAALLILPWSKRPYKNRRYLINVEDETGKFNKHLREFRETHDYIER